jgi:aldose 1-epimerase
VTLAAHGWEVELLPAIGGAIGALRHQGHDILRPAAPGTSDPLKTACFPLVPYANRIADGRFDFDGRSVQLPRNFGDHPHSLHGVGWQSAWTVEWVDTATMTLHHTHGGDARWPWSYRAEQRVALAPDRATIALRVTNLADQAAPVGLGLHPYFLRDAATRLTARSERLWLAGPTMLPTESAPADRLGDWGQGAGVDGETLIDTVYEGWDGVALIEQAWGRVRIDARGVSAFHLYRPPGADFFCFEPVSHLPDAINRGGMPVAAPGETVVLEMALTVVR